MTESIKNKTNLDENLNSPINNQEDNLNLMYSENEEDETLSSRINKAGGSIDKRGYTFFDQAVTSSQLNIADLKIYEEKLTQYMKSLPIECTNVDFNLELSKIKDQNISEKPSINLKNKHSKSNFNDLINELSRGDSELKESLMKLNQLCEIGGLTDLVIKLAEMRSLLHNKLNSLNSDHKNLFSSFYNDKTISEFKYNTFSNIFIEREKLSQKDLKLPNLDTQSSSYGILNRSSPKIMTADSDASLKQINSLIESIANEGEPTGLDEFY